MSGNGFPMYSPSDEENYYSQYRSYGGNKIIGTVTKLILPRLDKLLLGSRKSFVTCDYGTADGGASKPIFNAIIRRVRELVGSKCEISLIYEDQPSNNFTPILQQPPGWLNEADDNVFFFCTGRSFFERCAPTNYVNLAICTNALHNLSHTPCLLDTFCFIDTNDIQAKDQLRQTAACDYERFLLCRAQELSVGGILVIAVEQDLGPGGGEILKPRPKSAPGLGISLYPVFSRILAEMASKEVITEEENKKITMPYFLLSEADLREPFNDPKSTVSLAGLLLQSMSTEAIDCSIYDELLTDRHKDPGTAAENQADAMTCSLKASLYNIVLNNLSPSRSEEERIQITEHFFDKVHSVIRSQPQQYGLGIVYACLVITKINV